MGSLSRKLLRAQERDKQTVEKTLDRIGGAVNECRARGAPDDDVIASLLSLGGALALAKQWDERDFAVAATNAFVDAVRDAKQTDEEDEDDDDGG